MTRRIVTVLGLALCMLVSVSCSRPRPAPVQRIPQAAALAVAGFTQPQYNWELLAGYLPPGAAPIDEQTLMALDQELFARMFERDVGVKYTPAQTRQCQEIVLFEEQEGRLSAFKYWLDVGKCLPADYLLVPQVLQWGEREGTEWGVQRPATVVMDFYLIDVKNQGLVGRYHFEETQRSLSENILDAEKFIERGGKWITAMQLAGEAITQALEELGL